MLFKKNKLILIGLYLGFRNINYSYVHGNKSRIKIGKNCSTMNTIFNSISGDISIGNDTIFGHNCMVLTGTHKFIDGKISFNSIYVYLKEVLVHKDYQKYAIKSSPNINEIYKIDKWARNKTIEILNDK